MRRIWSLTTAIISGTLLALAGVTSALAATPETVDFYISAPNVLNTFAPGAVVETFDSAAFPANSACPTSWPTVGTISVSGSGTGCRINNANSFGGATAGAGSTPVTRPSGSGTRYVSVGSNSTVTLTLNQAETYLGFWWSAGDANNSVKLYSGGTGGRLVGSFSTASLVTMLNGGVGTVTAMDGTVHTTCDYYGNPVLTTSTCGGGREPFAYVHLVATGGLNFDTIVFSQGSSGGFEFDNMAISRFVTPPEELISFPPNLVPGSAVQQASTCTPFSSSLDWTASNFATAPTFSVSPALPSGFNMNPASGEFAGTATSAASLTTYTMTATAGSQSKSSTFTFEVNDIGNTPCATPPSPMLVASNTPLIAGACASYQSGIDWIAADFSGTPTFAISPGLPAGLNFNPATGEFSGTPTDTSAMTTYTVTATHDSESAQGTFQFKIVADKCLPNTGIDSHQSLLLTGGALAAVLLGSLVLFVTRKPAANRWPRR